MTDTKILELILQKITGLEQGQQRLESRLVSLEKRLDSLENRMDSLESHMDSLESRMDSLESRMDSLENQVLKLKLHIENTTDKNLQLLAENHINLVNRLNEAIPAADNNKAYEVKVNYLIEKVDNLEQQFAEHISKTA